MDFAHCKMVILWMRASLCKSYCYLGLDSDNVCCVDAECRWYCFLVSTPWRLVSYPLIFCASACRHWCTHNCPACTFFAHFKALMGVLFFYFRPALLRFGARICSLKYAQTCIGIAFCRDPFLSYITAWCNDISYSFSHCLLGDKRISIKFLYLFRVLSLVFGSACVVLI